MTIRAFRPKKKNCCICRTEFWAEKPMQHVCGVDCALAMAAAKREKAAAKKASDERKAKRAEKLAARAKLKTRSDYLKDCQTAFNAWVRERDHGQPCISCRRHHGGQYHAGHYRTVKAHPELRFEPLNVHRQCAPCNDHLSGNIVEYRKGLLTKIGPERLDWLEGNHEPKHYTIEELQALTKHYRAETRRIAKAREENQ